MHCWVTSEAMEHVDHIIDSLFYSISNECIYEYQWIHLDYSILLHRMSLKITSSSISRKISFTSSYTWKPEISICRLLNSLLYKFSFLTEVSFPLFTNFLCLGALYLQACWVQLNKNSENLPRTDFLGVSETFQI